MVQSRTRMQKVARRHVPYDGTDACTTLIITLVSPVK